MSSLIILFIALMLNNFAWMFAFLYLRDKDDKREQKRFREYILATKSRTTEQYVESLPSDKPLVMPEKDEIQELGETDPGDLLRAIKQEHEGN